MLRNDSAQARNTMRILRLKNDSNAKSNVVEMRLGILQRARYRQGGDARSQPCDPVRSRED
jgi:hypothetical protein